MSIWKEKDYHIGEIFYHHIWAKLKVGDIVQIRIMKGKKAIVKAKVLECIGIDKYKLEVVERLKYYFPPKTKIEFMKFHGEYNNNWWFHILKTRNLMVTIDKEWLWSYVNFSSVFILNMGYLSFTHTKI